MKLGFYSMQLERTYMKFLLIPRKLTNGEWAWLRRVWCNEIEHCLGYDGTTVSRTYRTDELKPLVRS